MKPKLLATAYTALIFLILISFIYVLFFFPHRVIPVIAIIVGIILIASVWYVIYRNLK